MLYSLLLIFSSLSFAELPNWVLETERSCKKNQICMVGNATGLNLAKANARLEIAKYFGTKVSSTFQVTTTSDNMTTDQFVNESLQESTEEVLEAVEFTKTHEASDAIYVLAVLDKRAAWRKIANLIKDLDSRLEEELASDKRTSIFALKKLYNERETLNLRYEFLRGNRLAQKVTHADILRKQSSFSKGVMVEMDVRKPIKEVLRSLLTQVGFRVVSRGGTHQLSGGLSDEKQYLNVDGFEKYKVTLNLVARNKSGETLGSINHTVSTTGRDKVQALAVAQEQLIDFLKQNLDELNF